ncbi:MAG: GNAT family N-acetyltransferase [Myxococcaceae bacterium]
MTAPGGYRIERVTSVEALGALRDAWRRLENEAANRLPFRTYEWASLWWKHFAENHAGVRDTLEVHALWHADGTLAAAAPLMLTERPGKGPLRLRMLHFFGADPNITELRGPLFHPAHAATAVQALWGTLVERTDCDWLDWSGFAPGSPEDPFVENPASARVLRDIPNYVLSLSDTWDTFRTGLKHNIKESLRKCYNSLKRDGHDFVFRALDTPQDIQPALERFFELHALRAQQDGTVLHRDVFQAGASRAFLTEVCNALAERNVTRVFTLSVGDAIVALRIGFVLQDSVYLYYSGYDPAWGKYSIMTTVVAETLKWAIASGLKTANLSTGTDVSKTRWGPTEHLFREARWVQPSLRGRLAHGTYQRLQALKQNPRLRSLLARRR